MAALIAHPAIFVFTHDSIGLGEDGPTHQSVEHAASLRLIPQLDVWRPVRHRRDRGRVGAALERATAERAAVHAAERAVRDARPARRRRSARRLRARRFSAASGARAS
jgi:transketolase